MSRDEMNDYRLHSSFGPLIISTIRTHAAYIYRVSSHQVI